MEVILPHLEPWQRDVYDAIMNRKEWEDSFIVKARRQVGKSILAEVLLLTFSLQKKKRVSAIVEPTLNQSRRVFKQIMSMIDGGVLVKSANASLLTIEFVNGSEILFKSAEQMEALRGMTISGLLVIDEGAFIPDEIYDILSPTTDVHNAPTLIISTPLFEDGRFYEMYTNGMSKTFDWSKYDTSKFLSREKLEQYRREMSPNKFKSEYLGEFITEGSYTFGNIKPCLISTLSENPSIYCGIDWGTGNNGDYTAVVMLDEFGDMTFLDYFNRIEPVQQIERIAGILNNTPTLEKINVEKNSIGAVYYDLLKKAYKKPAIINTFNTDNDSKRRIIEKMAGAIEGGNIHLLDDDELTRQFHHYAMEKTPSGKITYNALPNYHDDIVMATAMCYDLIGNNASYCLSLNKKKNNFRMPLRTKYGEY